MRAGHSSVSVVAARWWARSFSRIHHAAQQSVRRAAAVITVERDLLPSKAVTWIDKGVVANLAYDRYWAAKTGKEPTGAGAADAGAVAEEAVGSAAARAR